MDVRGSTACLQSKNWGKTLTALSGVAYAEISEISALLNVPKLSRIGSYKAKRCIWPPRVEAGGLERKSPLRYLETQVSQGEGK